MPNFVQFLLTGNAKSTDKLADTAKFLQGQLTANVAKITDTFLPTAICNLKGRVQFGLWLKQCENGYHIVLSSDLAEDFANHVKKYGAFSKVELAENAKFSQLLWTTFPLFQPILLIKTWKIGKKSVLSKAIIGSAKTVANCFNRRNYAYISVVA